MSPLAAALTEPDLDAIPGRLPTGFACSGCGYRLPPEEPVRLACPMARPEQDIDHVLVRVLEPSRLAFPSGADPNPFVRYRTLLHGYHVARAGGSSDGDVTRLIRRLDRDVARVDGHGFRTTPFARADELGAALGLPELWIKDETGNVSGSHKARHLFGTLLELELGGGERVSSVHRLAIASCGNAALAAAIVARAAGRSLEVFIPIDADPAVVARLEALDAQVTVCPRETGAAGDPTFRRLRAAVAEGAVAFTCQGSLNGLAVEGGETLGWEMTSDLVARDANLDHIVIQVGGGALASAVIQAFGEAYQLGALRSLPAFHAVQTRGAFPLARAYERLAGRLAGSRLEEDLERELAWAATHRSEFMWPWETEPHSVAGGILDDETYDWLAVAGGMLRTGGVPVIVDEAALRAANDLAVRHTGVDVDHTGSAGLAGAIELLRRGTIGPDDRVAVIFTGIRRRSASPGEPT
ncbi:MAG TPA: pyridoxal-phosphate dependent enzyme [Candidatus Limnocylindria bacterium]|nr:pyridoxal-phosphate dependent enzyme [Candidatus Limnocylindria bacterium]